MHTFCNHDVERSRYVLCVLIALGVPVCTCTYIVHVYTECMCAYVCVCTFNVHHVHALVCTANDPIWYLITTVIGYMVGYDYSIPNRTT